MCASGVSVRFQFEEILVEGDVVKYTRIVYCLERIFLNQSYLLAKNVGYSVITLLGLGQSQRWNRGLRHYWIQCGGKISALDKVTMTSQ